MKNDVKNDNVVKIDKAFISTIPTIAYDGPCIWVTSGRRMFQFIYFRKPKWVFDKDFDKAMEIIEVTGLDGLEFELEPEPEKKKDVKVTGK